MGSGNNGLIQNDNWIKFNERTTYKDLDRVKKNNERGLRKYSQKQEAMTISGPGWGERC